MSGLAKNGYVTFSTPKMEAESPFHATINFCRKHNFRTEKTVLFAVTILTHTKGLNILYSAIYKSLIETMKGEIRAWVKEIKQKINKVTKNQGKQQELCPFKKGDNQIICHRCLWTFSTLLLHAILYEYS